LIDSIVGSDYINANYLDGYRKQNAYIATQGPLPNTFADFWRMIWETNSVCIVMMTKLEERNRLKCDQYWPSRGTETYGSIQVTLTDFIELASYSIRTFTIAWVRLNGNFYLFIEFNDFRRVIRKNEKFDNVNSPLGLVENLSLLLRHLFFIFIDHGILEHATAFLMFVRRVKILNPIDAGPVIVHCSAGVGRTGCFIVIDALLERLKHEKTIDIYGHVTVLRAQR
jgi:netrin-G3 ligand